MAHTSRPQRSAPNSIINPKRGKCTQSLHSIFLEGRTLHTEHYGFRRERLALSLWRKDIQRIAPFAAVWHCPVPLFTATAEPCYAALGQRLGDLNTAAVCAVFEEAARVVRAPRAEEPSDNDRK